MAPHMPLQHLNQGCRAVRLALFCRCGRDPAAVLRGRIVPCGAACGHRRQQVARGFRGSQQIIRQAHHKSLLDACQQFDPRQAVQAQILFQ